LPVLSARCSTRKERVSRRLSTFLTIPPGAICVKGGDLSFLRSLLTSYSRFGHFQVGLRDQQPASHRGQVKRPGELRCAAAPQRAGLYADGSAVQASRQTSGSSERLATRLPPSDDEWYVWGCPHTCQLRSRAVLPTAGGLAIPTSSTHARPARADE